MEYERHFHRMHLYQREVIDNIQLVKEVMDMFWWPVKETVQMYFGCHRGWVDQPGWYGGDDYGHWKYFGGMSVWEQHVEDSRSLYHNYPIPFEYQLMCPRLCSLSPFRIATAGCWTSPQGVKGTL
jgi:hypothetical protein